MTKKKQRYCLVFRARADVGLSAEEKHARFFQAIRDLPVPWGLGDRPVPPAPEFGRLSSASIGLNRFFGNGIINAVLSYRYRQMLEDKGSSDDSLQIDLDPTRLDLHHLLYLVVPRYIEAFDAYRVGYYDEEFVNLAWRTPIEQRIQTDARSDVRRVEIVSFYDELLCRRAFTLSPGDVLESLQGRIEHGRLLHNGAYVVGSSQVLSFGEAQELCRIMTIALARQG